MLKRKVVTTLIATPLSLLVIFAVFFREWRQPLELIVMTGTFSIWLSPIILLYAVPVTLLSDVVGKRLTGNSRTILAFVVHLLFGAMFGFIKPMDTGFSFFGGELDSSFIFASITALFFWIIDEMLRRTTVKCKLCFS